MVSLVEPTSSNEKDQHLGVGADIDDAETVLLMEKMIS